MATWFEIEFTGEPTDADRERVAELVRDGFTSGQLLSEAVTEDEMPVMTGDSATHNADGDAYADTDVSGIFPGIRQSIAASIEGQAS